MSLNEFKNELESKLLITEWSPSDEQLRSIANNIKQLGYSPRKSDVEKAVLDVVGSYQGLVLEAIDNTDLKALLLLATKVLENDK